MQRPFPSTGRDLPPGHPSGEITPPADPLPTWSEGCDRYADLLAHLEPDTYRPRPDSLQTMDDQRSAQASAPPYPYEGDLDDQPRTQSSPRLAFPAVRPATPGGRLNDRTAPDAAARHALEPNSADGLPRVEPKRLAADPLRARSSYEPTKFPRRLPYDPDPSVTSTPPAYSGFTNRSAGNPGAGIAAGEQTQTVLPQRVPAEPDVPTVPEPHSVEPTAETPALARIATHLRRGDLLPAEQRQEGFDVNDILAAVREVEGVRDASLRRTPAGAHSLRLDLADGADPADVSRQVARLLQDRMGLDAAMQGGGLPAGPAPVAPGVGSSAASGALSAPPSVAGSPPATSSAASGDGLSAAPVVPPVPSGFTQAAAPPAASPRAEPEGGSGFGVRPWPESSLDGSSQAESPQGGSRFGIPPRPVASPDVSPQTASFPSTSAQSASPNIASPRVPTQQTRPQPTAQPSADLAPPPSSTFGRSPALPTTPLYSAAPACALPAATTPAAQAATNVSRQTSARQGLATAEPRSAVGRSERPATAEPGPTAFDSAPARPLGIGARPGPRVLIENVQVNTFGTEAAVEVRLGVSGRTATGVATGPAVDSYLLRLCATATGQAIDELLLASQHVDGPAKCFIEHATSIPFGQTQVVMVVLLLSCGGWIEELAGSAVVTGDDAQRAIVRATLAAVNRRLEALLSW